MKDKKTFYVTTPIYYPNDVPHIGHAYTTIAADILARWNHLNGKEVFFLTGNDEHGKKIERAAETARKTSKTFVDHLIPAFKEAWSLLNVKYDRFIRTTDSNHVQVVQEILAEVKSGIISKLKSDFLLGKVRFWERESSRHRIPFVRIDNYSAHPQGLIVTPLDAIDIRYHRKGRTIDQNTELKRIQLLGSQGLDFVGKVFITNANDAIFPKSETKDKHLLIYCDSQHLHNGRVK